MRRMIDSRAVLAVIVSSTMLAFLLACDSSEQRYSPKMYFEVTGSDAREAKLNMRRYSVQDQVGLALYGVEEIRPSYYILLGALQPLSDEVVLEIDNRLKGNLSPKGRINLIFSVSQIVPTQCRLLTSRRLIDEYCDPSFHDDPYRDCDWVVQKLNNTCNSSLRSKGE